ncbi:hypothetical protein CAPTEDRAFT_227831 [Capitella teleta]|uniref:Uncharacterized protein n=1 Tax=Capitella teleta TaxID=283909 RepID=R7TTJ6_CAPTE|nr:hypothetical protein CAPTEDRAFT_227831 [Capitella teleta]|eukprot:ELT97238.1 hypothetical protein CAPTEDRAFT_227831 [Capitella teleta]
MAQDGLWLNNEREKLLMSLADDSQHCACRSQWSQALEEYEKEIPDTKEVYVRAVDMVTGNCSPDKCKWDCACEAISNTYRCHKFPTTTIPPTTTTVPPPTPVPSWLWPAVGAGGGLLFLIILITCCVCCCRNGRNSDPPPYPGPELPTPPVPRRRRKLEIMGADNTYGNWEPIDNEYAEADANGMNGTQEFYVSPETEEFHEVDHDLPGWTDFLVEEIRLKNLIHLGVHNVNKERWSMTPGVKVQRKEVKDIYKIFVDPKATRKSKPRIDMKLGGNRYRIDMGESSEGNHILATRKMKDGREQVAVVVREEHYLLVGISGADQKMVLLASCQDLSSHFQGIYGTNDL